MGSGAGGGPSSPPAGRRHRRWAFFLFALPVAAVLFVVVAPTTYVVNFQLAGGVWMLQVLPGVMLTLFLAWLDGHAVLAGWVAGTALGTWLLGLMQFKTTSYSVSLFGHDALIYIGVLAVVVNLAVALAGSGLVRLAAARRAGRSALVAPVTAPAGVAR